MDQQSNDAPVPAAEPLRVPAWLASGSLAWVLASPVFPWASFIRTRPLVAWVALVVVLAVQVLFLRGKSAWFVGTSTVGLVVRLLLSGGVLALLVWNSWWAGVVIYALLAAAALSLAFRGWARHRKTQD